MASLRVRVKTIWFAHVFEKFLKITNKRYVISWDSMLVKMRSVKSYIRDEQKTHQFIEKK